MYLLDDELTERIVRKSQVCIDDNTLQAIKQASYEQLSCLIVESSSLSRLIKVAYNELCQEEQSAIELKNALTTIGRPVLIKLAYCAHEL